jgi:hypothetical protein
MPFVRNDTAYREWLEQHPGGFVLNYEVDGPNPDYLVLHRADCPTIQVRSNLRWTYAYGKFCRDRRLPPHA